jgi:hypothetical protein
MQLLARRVSPVAASLAVIVAVLLPSSAGAQSVAVGTEQSPISATYSQVILADQPSMYWRLGERAGTVAHDASGNARNAKYVNGPTLHQKGAIVHDPNKAVLFDGVDDFARWNPAQLSYHGPFSVEGWVGTNISGNGIEIWLSSRTPSDYGFDIMLIKSETFGYGVGVDVGDGSQWLVTETFSFPWRQSVWYHVVAVATLTDVTVYVDDASLGSSSYTGTPLLYDLSHQLKISSFFSGKIDEVAVYESALTSEQVAAHYAAGINPSR